jgi:F0F1-type ATP synthase membrane subunit c/vacuolar-type H+-ATPase subunit K
MVLFVALVEVTAIYGFIIANKIIQTGWENMAAVWAWLAIWLAWLWVGIWRWYLSEWALEIMWQNPKMISYLLTVSILWVALVESAAIYAWIISYKILWSAEVFPLAAIWAWLAIWATWLWAWVWEWLLIKWAIKWMNYSPENKNQILTFMILFVALVESAAIYWLIVAFKLLW